MKSTLHNPVGQQIVEEELRLLARVTSALSEMGAQVPGAPDFNQALINLRDQIAEAKPEDIGPLVEQMMRISAVAQSYGKGRDLPVNPLSPYFGHLRLREHRADRDVLVGKRGFVDRRRQVQIVDWRNAPISRLYYRYEEGDDYDESIGDIRLEGIIEARRSLTIDQGQLRRVAAPQGVFVADDQGGWFEAAAVAVAELRGGQRKAARAPALAKGSKGSALGVHSQGLRVDKHLPEIAALVDPQQFDLIVQPSSGLVLLEGGAGSGKTTVALHRVAYLNYHDPKRYRPERMVVIVLTEAMVRYVSRVLPSLGVKGVSVMTAQAWFRRTRRKVVPTSFGRYNEETPAVVLRLKKHPVMLPLLREFVDRQVARLEQDLHAAVAGTPDGEQVMATWRSPAGQAPIKRCAALRAWLRQQDRQLSAVTVQQAQTATRQMHRRLKDLMADWAEVLTDRALLTEMMERVCPGELSPRQLDQVCSWCAAQSDEGPEAVRHHARESGDDEDAPYVSLDGQDERELPLAGRLDAPDDALLLLLAQLKHGALQPKGGRPMLYEHLVVDEAQDLSVIETKVLLDSVDPRGSVTLAGDVAQRLAFDNAFVGWQSLLEQLGAATASVGTLKLGYRSTEQIMALARFVARGPGDPETEWRPQRGGAAVELFHFGDQGEAVALLVDALRSLTLREPLASVACIARHPEQAQSYASALRQSEVPGVRLVSSGEFSFKPGIEVTEVTQVKGLEFDYVILLDVTAANYPDTEESRHMLYIGATRAAHQLWLLSPGLPSPLLPAGL